MTFSSQTDVCGHKSVAVFLISQYHVVVAPYAVSVSFMHRYNMLATVFMHATGRRQKLLKITLLYCV